jgi:hypothetical protein
MNDSVSRLNDPNALVETLAPTDVRDLLGKPAMLANEDPSDYDALLDALASEVKPRDLIERLWVKDIADLTWEILRYRRIKAARINGQFKTVLTPRLKPALECDLKAARPGSSWMGKLEAARETLALAQDEANRLANNYFADTQVREKVDAILKGQGLGTDTMIAEAFVAGIGHMEALDKMAASAEHRRNNALREIERRRSAVGHGLRRTSDRIIEVEAPLVPLAAE